MPTYSAEGPDYIERVHQNGRQVNAEFEPQELLFRRYPERALVGGKPSPLSGLEFEETSGHSVNRGRHSEPADVLEADCCDGKLRSGYVVLDFQVKDIPESIAVPLEPARTYQFKMKHVPQETCFAHSEIWCNRSGDVEEPYERPPKTVRDLFRARLCSRIVNPPRRFEAKA